MATEQVTERNFEAIIGKGVVLLDFWAGWCGPCRAFGPVFEAAAARHPDVVFGKIDTDAERGLASAFEIRAIPTLVVVRDGLVVFQQPGVLPASALDALIAQVKALDMKELTSTSAGEPTPSQNSAP